MSAQSSTDNPYLNRPLGALFLRTAAPIIFVMCLNGAQNIVDAWILGQYIGAEALGAVTVVFPLFFVLVALSALVASGMSSELARALGAGDMSRAYERLAGAHGLAFAISLALIFGFALFGTGIIEFIAGGDTPMARDAHSYLQILVYAAPLSFAIALQSDALRVEGRVALMTIAGIFITLMNAGLDWLFVARLGLGVAGSAKATVLAQLLGMAIIIAYRASGRTRLGLRLPMMQSGTRGWGRILSLGIPQSFNLIGLSLTSGSVIAMVRLYAPDDYDTLVAAYGVIMRVLSFAFLGQLGMSHALTAIAGNNIGAGQYARANRALHIAMGIGLLYAVTIETVLITQSAALGAVFVDDAGVVAAVGRIMPVVVMFYFAAGPQAMVGAFFQAMGDARRAAIMGLSRIYLFVLPLTFVLPRFLGEPGIWMTTPIAELCMVCITTTVLVTWARGRGAGLLELAPVATAPVKPARP